MDTLPKEIKQLIFSFLDPFIRHTARLTSKQWHSLITKTMFMFRITSEPVFEAKMKQLAQMPEQLAFKFPYNNKLTQETIENSLTKMQNLVSLDLSNKYQLFPKRQPYLAQLEYLKIFRPSIEYVNALTRIRRLNFIYDVLEDIKFNFSTTIEDLTFVSTSNSYLDPDATLQLNDHYSRLTRLYIKARGYLGPFSSLMRLSLSDLSLKQTISKGARAPMGIAELLKILNHTKLIEDISSMTTLTRLVVGFSIKEADSEKLARLTGLRCLSIRDYNVNMTYWRYLTNLENIQIFSIKETGCTLENLPAEKLTKLSFSISKEGYDKKKIIEHINRLRHLKALDLRVHFNYNFVTKVSLPYLENLSLIGECDSMDLQQAPNLKTLTVSLNQLLKSLDLPPNLEKIHLLSSTNSKESVRAEIFPNLASLTNMKELYVNLTNGSIDVIHENISQMTQLEHLELNVENSVLDEELLQSLINLKSLKLDMQLKSNDGTGSFLSSMTNLNKLELSKYGCNNECVIALSKFSNLTYLHIRKPAEDIAVASIVHLTNLQCLLMPIDLRDYRHYLDLRVALREILPFLETYRPAP